MKPHRAISFVSGQLRSLATVIGLVGLLSSAACADVSDVSEDPADSPATEKQGLRRGGGTLPWRGDEPSRVMSSASFDVSFLGVVWAVDIGMTRVCTGGILGIGQECHHELRGLQVMTYAPSNPNNFYTPGDRTASSIIGRNTAGQWTRQTCPGGTVMSGYNIWSRSSRIEKLAVRCRDLLSGVEQTLTPNGSTSLLFADLLSCPDYVGSIELNANGDGMGATCVSR